MQHDIARLTAVQVLNDIARNNAYSGLSLKEGLKNKDLSDRDRRFVTRLVMGTIEKELTLDRILTRFVTIEPDEYKLEVILRLGLYQILYLDGVPERAACHQSVELAKTFCKKGRDKLVNGVLRNVLRNLNQLRPDDTAEGTVAGLSYDYSFPEWILNRWVADYGLKKTAAIVKASVDQHNTTLRCRTSLEERQTLLDELEEKGIKTLEGSWFDDALRTELGQSVDELESFRSGAVTVIGESAMLVCRLLNPKKGQKVLDACAAPGGKTLYIADIMGDFSSDGELSDGAELIAWDLHPHRVELIRQNMARLRLPHIKTQVKDAAVREDGLVGRYDRILLDVPCSGLGVLASKPDIKNRLRPEQIPSLCGIQARLLETCSAYLKVGGLLVYSTCTISREENEAQIESFLKNHPAYQLDSFIKELPEPLQKQVDTPGFIQLLPDENGIEGFFICRLKRVEE